MFNSNGHLLTFLSSFDLVRARNTTDSENLPRITPIRTKLGLNYSYKDYSSYVNTTFVESQSRVSQFELPTESYNLLDLGLSYKFNLKEKRFVELFLKGTNLANDEARVHNSFLKDQAPLRGRAIFTGITANF